MTCRKCKESVPALYENGRCAECNGKVIQTPPTSKESARAFAALIEQPEEKREPKRKYGRPIRRRRIAFP